MTCGECPRPKIPQDATFSSLLTIVSWPSTHVTFYWRPEKWSHPARREPLNSIMYSESSFRLMCLWQICDLKWWWEWVAGTNWDSAVFVLFAISCRLFTANNVRRRERENCLGQFSLAAMENPETKAARARNNFFFPGSDSPVYSEPWTPASMVWGFFPHLLV